MKDGDIDTKSTKMFAELIVHSKKFHPQPHDPDQEIQFKEILEVPSTTQGSTHGSEVLSLFVETQFLNEVDAASSDVNISRVVLVNEQGERVLDTLVAPQKDVPVLTKQMADLFQFAKKNGEDLQSVRWKVKDLVKRKSLVSLDLPTVVKQIGIQDLLEGDYFHFNLSQLIESDDQSKETPLPSLAEKLLNLKLEEETCAFTYAKIQMALLQRWMYLQKLNPTQQELPQELEMPPEKFDSSSVSTYDEEDSYDSEEDSNNTEDDSEKIVVLTGAQLKQLI